MVDFCTHGHNVLWFLQFYENHKNFDMKYLSEKESIVYVERGVIDTKDFKHNIFRLT